MLIAILGAFVIVPVISSIFVMFGIMQSTKYRKVYLVCISFMLAIIAYYLEPPTNFDLYRHHQVVIELQRLDWGQIFNYALEEKEILRVLIMAIVAKIGNIDLLQFVVAFIGYSILFLIIDDYAKRFNIKKWIFILCIAYITFVSLNYINFISGLWNYFAMIVFLLGIYMEYVLKCNKKLCYAIYLITPLIHISLLFMVILKVVFSFAYKEKLNWKTLTITAVIFIVPQLTINLLSHFSNISLVSTIIKMYDSYFVNGSQFEVLHGGVNLALALIRAAICIYMYTNLKNKEQLDKFTVLALVTTLVLIINAGVFIRYVTMTDFMAIPLFMKYFSQTKTKGSLGQLFVICMIIFTIAMAGFKIKTVMPYNYGQLFNEKIFSNVITIFNK